MSVQSIADHSTDEEVDRRAGFERELGIIDANLAAAHYALNQANEALRGIARTDLAQEIAGMQRKLSLIRYTGQAHRFSVIAEQQAEG